MSILDGSLFVLFSDDGWEAAPRAKGKMRKKTARGGYTYKDAGEVNASREKARPALEQGSNLGDPFERRMVADRYDDAGDPITAHSHRAAARLIEKFPEALFAALTGPSAEPGKWPRAMALHNAVRQGAPDGEDPIWADTVDHLDRLHKSGQIAIRYGGGVPSPGGIDNVTEQPPGEMYRDDGRISDLAASFRRYPSWVSSYLEVLPVAGGPLDPQNGVAKQIRRHLFELAMGDNFVHVGTLRERLRGGFPGVSQNWLDHSLDAMESTGHISRTSLMGRHWVALTRSAYDRTSAEIIEESKKS